ncbi:MAG: 3-dehydroquinate synthase [Bacteroidota bacterium]
MVRTQRIQVSLKNARDRSYDILIKPGLLAEIPQLLVESWATRRFFIISDDNVSALYARQFQQTLGGMGAETTLLEFRAGERSKTAAVVHSLHTALLENNISRDALIVAFGGGVVGDVAGFVAATVLRGVRYVQVPTTLLAQVDSSVGGKVGVDHALGKNLIGAFHQPSAVYIDPEMLKTLPPEEFSNGLAELVKVAAALDDKLFADIERKATLISRSKSFILADFIEEAVGLKASVVEHDEYDTGIRRVLNLGHTVAHAVETATDYRIKHGHAVAIGLAVESEIAVRMGILPEKEFVRLVALLQELGLPVRMPRMNDMDRFFDAMALDKKGEGKGTKFVLMKSIGHTVVGADVPVSLVMEILGARKK